MDYRPDPVVQGSNQIQISLSLHPAIHSGRNRDKCILIIEIQLIKPAASNLPVKNCPNVDQIYI